MKVFAIACLFVVAAGSLTGCTSIALEDLDADMPTVLVEKYRAAKTPYADKGFFWLPLVTTECGRVSVTADGFHALRVRTIGPLMLLLGTGSSSDFDRDGRLVRHSSMSAPLWGLLFFEENSTDRAKDESSYRFRILLGALGYHEMSDRAKTFYFLYIPIPISRGDAQVSGT